jgi:hypothetical protein
VAATIGALLPKLKTKTDRSHLDDALANYRKARAGLDELATGKPGRRPIHPQYVAKLIDKHAADDAVFTFDVGTPTIWAARYLKMNGRRRMIGSLAPVTGPSWHQPTFGWAFRSKMPRMLALEAFENCTSGHEICFVRTSSLDLL